MVILCVVSDQVLIVVRVYILAVICGFLMTCLKERDIWCKLHFNPLNTELNPICQ